jgi:hypothetical protein
LVESKLSGNEFTFTFFPFTLKLVNGLSLVNYAGSSQLSLAGVGCFWAAGQLADCHIHLPVCLVAVGQ